MRCNYLRAEFYNSNRRLSVIETILEIYIVFKDAVQIILMLILLADQAYSNSNFNGETKKKNAKSINKRLYIKPVKLNILNNKPLSIDITSAL